ncbi:Pycsar system effector family protein [Candidatus Blastococcus massiliensis]|uniref:Pycsar system effector family protein n=1 Tax=Candidatus Blastococcus massiliensis TaxID=1470358 RepID=UPI0012DF5061|nr:Pycsar system effector family protein [Candidatus Blastococcus massiliensis]
MRFLRRRPHGRPAPEPIPDDVPVEVDPARPWEVLSLVNEWVRHAEAKAGTILAAAGVVAGVLYSLLDKQSQPPWTLTVPAAACGLLAALAGFMSIIALWPQLRAREAPTSLLYFDHIARAYNTPEAYGRALRGLVTSGETELQQVAQQVWVNATVARRKYLWAGRALVLLIASIVACSWTGTYLALNSIGLIGG